MLILPASYLLLVVPQLPTTYAECQFFMVERSCDDNAGELVSVYIMNLSSLTV